MTGKAERYTYLSNRELWRTSETNRKLIDDFIIDRRATGLSIQTVENYVYNISKCLTYFDNDDIRTVSKEQVSRAYFQWQNEVIAGDLKDSSLNLRIISLQVFFNYLFGTEKTKELITVKKRTVRNLKENTDYITEDDVKRMRDYAETQGDVRGVALIMVLFGTGARISELLDAKIKDVEFKQYNAVIKVNGKTGFRKIPFVIGMPELINWINHHPCRDADGRPDSNAYIFVSYVTRGHTNTQLKIAYVDLYMRRVARLSGVNPAVKSSPHAFRHLLATKMARKLTIKEMNLFFGWETYSNTAMTYIHTSQEELEHNILQINGIERPEDTEPKEWVIQCPCCKEVLPAGSIQCPKCRMILDPVLAVKVDAISEDMSRREVMDIYFQNRSA